MTDERSTDFGFQRVPREDKARRVRGVFDSVAEHYDLMNDLMSAGAHRIWKRFTLALANLRPGQRALDVAGGSGDLAAGLARQVGERGLIVLTDINAVEPVGQYAVKLVFDDGHDTGLYTWKYLHELGRDRAAKWARYLERKARERPDP